MMPATATAARHARGGCGCGLRFGSGLLGALGLSGQRTLSLEGLLTFAGSLGLLRLTGLFRGTRDGGLALEFRLDEAEVRAPRRWRSAEGRCRR